MKNEPHCIGNRGYISLREIKLTSKAYSDIETVRTRTRTRTKRTQCFKK